MFVISKQKGKRWWITRYLSKLFARRALCRVTLRGLSSQPWFEWKLQSSCSLARYQLMMLSYTAMYGDYTQEIKTVRKAQKNSTKYIPGYAYYYCCTAVVVTSREGKIIQTTKILYAVHIIRPAKIGQNQSIWVTWFISHAFRFTDNFQKKEHVRTNVMKCLP